MGGVLFKQSGTTESPSLDEGSFSVFLNPTFSAEVGNHKPSQCACN